MSLKISFVQQLYSRIFFSKKDSAIASASRELADGRRRLRRVAKVCEDYGQRVQNSVFECLVDAGGWTKIRAKLIAEISGTQDSLRFYFLGDNWKGRIEHVGAKPSYDPQGPLIF